MAQRGGSGPRGGSGDDGYDWLYGQGSRGGSSGGRSAGRQDDAEPTQVIPSTSSVSGGARGGAARDSAPPTSIAREPGRERVRRGPRLRRRRRLRPVRVVLLLLLAYLVFLVAVPVWAYFDVTKVDAEPAGQRPDDGDGTNYLVVGSDERPGLSGRRTDTIMLLHTGSGPNVLMSIPRDSIVEIPGRGTDKINAAFAFGGPQLLVRTVEQNTGIFVDDYVEVGFTGLVNIVDAVGGITICPKEAIKDPLARLDVQAGCQEADGRTALGYARTRKFGTGDIQRGRNQREVVSAIGREMLSWQTFVNPVRYYRVVTGGAESVRIGEETGPWALAKFGLAMNRVDGEAGMACTVPIADLAVNWDRERAERLFGYLQRDEAGDIPADLCTPTGQPE